MDFTAILETVTGLFGDADFSAILETVTELLGDIDFSAILGYITTAFEWIMSLVG